MTYSEVIDLLKSNNLLVTSDPCNSSIKYLSCNSKDVKKDTLFFCKGFNYKEEYLNEAINSGAVCYVSERAYLNDIPAIIVNDIRKSMAIIAKAFYDVLDKKLYTIGITGTKGKTTTVYFLHNVLNEWQNKKTAYISTIDYFTGKSHGASHNTTPDSLELFSYIKEIKESNIDYLAMEISSQAVKLNRIYGIDYEMGCFLNIGMDHIAPFEHKDFQEYLDCKVSFLKQCKKVFIFKQTDKYDYIIDELKGKDIVTFGFTEDCDYFIHDITKDDEYTNFLVRANNIDEQYKIIIHGKYNCINAACAIAVAKSLGIAYEYIYKGLIKTLVEGRMSIFSKGVCPIIVDYAHNRISIENFILALKEDYPGKNLKFVIGCPGDKAFNRRKEVGELMSKYAAYTYLTAEDPQSKEVKDICDEIISYMDKDAKYEVIEDRENAIIKAISEATPDDVISILGKGEETYQLVKGIYLSYKSDMKVVEDELNKIMN